ncbi:endonuclease I family protein [Halobacillus halophilus]|uniref:endonuclease I family protein n=1 Tax=Halobacillus halophilus TaxID=1570 RepID=UPI001CD620C7|nr:endonuclease [Halobacillus halophilus]MCA1009156.1 endonuclease [Halobacillus halophilus]
MGQKFEKRQPPTRADVKQLEQRLLQTKTTVENILKDQRLYYDPDKSEQSIKSYYRNINFQEANRKAIEDLIQSSHHKKVLYDPGEYVYPWVDLRPDGKLRSIYSGEAREPEDVIQEDFEAYLKMKAASEETENPSEFSTLLKYNCEHVVPQSWYDKKEPMRGDLHHLFTCDPQCNSIRSNYPYYDFANYPVQEAGVNRVESHCGKTENEYFEPEYAKGTVARSMLYFLIRYPEEIEPVHRKKVNEELLLQWHEAEPPSLYEHHRNEAIYSIQGNRNPFIDFPEQMRTVFYTQ